MGGKAKRLLHGYSETGVGQLDYFGLEAVAEQRGLLVAFPDGTRDQFGSTWKRITTWTRPAST